jgi:hypothetical protein
VLRLCRTHTEEGRSIVKCMVCHCHVAEFFLRNSINVDTYTHINTHLYEHTKYPIFMSTSEILSRLNLKIYEVGHQERLVVDGDIISH